MSGDTLTDVEIVTVSRSDGRTAQYVLAEEHQDGKLILRRETSHEAILGRLGSRAATSDEFEAAFGDLPTGPA